MVRSTTGVTQYSGSSPFLVSRLDLCESQLCINPHDIKITEAVCSVEWVILSLQAHLPCDPYSEWEVVISCHHQGRSGLGGILRIFASRNESLSNNGSSFSLLFCLLFLSFCLLFIVFNPSTPPYVCLLMHVRSSTQYRLYTFNLTWYTPVGVPWHRGTCLMWVGSQDQGGQ